MFGCGGHGTVQVSGAATATTLLSVLFRLRWPIPKSVSSANMVRKVKHGKGAVGNVGWYKLSSLVLLGLTIFVIARQQEKHRRKGMAPITNPLIEITSDMVMTIESPCKPCLNRSLNPDYDPDDENGKLALAPLKSPTLTLPLYI